MILLAEHDEPSLAAKKKRRHVASEKATPTPKNRVWIFFGSRLGRTCSEPDLSAETATGSVQFSYENASGRGYYYSRDHLGSIRELVNSSGTLLTRYSYDPYGRVTPTYSSANTSTPPVDATFQYTGDYAHQPSGLNLTRYRAYDPNTARWLSRDPIAEKGGLNLYEYVTDEPVANTDPLGLDTWTGPIHPDQASGFAGDVNMFVPPTFHQAGKFVDAIANFFGVPGDPAGANALAATVFWTKPCGDKPLLQIVILTKPTPSSGGEAIEGENASMEVKTRWAIVHTNQQAIAATTATFRCGECKKGAGQ